MSADLSPRGENDPIRVILARILENPDSSESQVLIKAVLCVISERDNVTVAELCSLGEEALGLLDAFVRERMAGRYEHDFLDGLVKRLHAMGRIATGSSPLAA